MVGAVSLDPYVSGYQYSGSARMRASAQNMQVQSGQRSGAAAGGSAVSTRRTGGVSSLIGARSIAAAGQASGVAGVSAGRGADPESPVQPVDAVSKLQRNEAGSTNYMIPFLRQGMDPAELAVRMRIQYTGADAAGQSQTGVSRDAAGEATQMNLPGSVQGAGAEAVQMNLPGNAQEAGAEAVQMNLPGSTQGAGAEAVQMNLPGSAQGADKEAVQLDLPGSTQEAEEAAQINLPGTSAGEAEQLGVPGTQTGKAAEAGLPGDASKTDTSNADSKAEAPKIAGLNTEDTQKTTEDTECKTCKERKYQDGSNDPGVSFKSPTHIGPEQSASAVLGHEMEHVVRERAKAQSEGRRVVSQSVTMQTGICPECGKVYVAGGVTRTTTAAETTPQEERIPRMMFAATA